MSVTRFACPACHAVLHSGNPLEEGRKIKCRECGVIFPVRPLASNGVAHPVAVPAAPTPPPPSSTRRRQREHAAQARAYERAQEKSNNLILALGSILVLIALTGLVVGLFLLAGDRSDTRVARRDPSASGEPSSTPGRATESRRQANVPAEANEGEEERPPRDRSRKQSSVEDGPDGAGTGAASIDEPEKPRMPKPGEGLPLLGGKGTAGARAPKIPPGPGMPQDPQHPGYPPGYKPPEGKEGDEEDDKPGGRGPIPPNYPGAPPSGGASGGLGTVGGSAPGARVPAGKAPPGYPGRPGIPGTPGPGGTLPAQPGGPGMAGGEQLPGFPPNRPPPKKERDPREDSKLPDLPADWPKYRNEFPNQGLELSFKNTLNVMLVVGIRFQKSEKGFEQGTDLLIEPGETGSAYLRSGYYEVFLVNSRNPSEYHELGRVALQDVASYRIVKEDGKYLLHR